MKIIDKDDSNNKMICQNMTRVGRREVTANCLYRKKSVDMHVRYTVIHVP